MSKSQSCRTCRHLDVQPDADGRRVPRKGLRYRCTWPLASAKLADSVTCCFAFASLQPTHMAPDEGKRCPTWEALP